MGNLSLVRVGGVCAILVVVSSILARISFGNAWLQSRGVETLIIGHWFDVLALCSPWLLFWGSIRPYMRREPYYGLRWWPTSPVSSFFLPMNSSD